MTRANNYRGRIAHLCIKAGVPHWHPHQLRHNAATTFRKELGLETARLILGHSSVNMTDVSAEADLTKVIEAAASLG